MSLAEARVAWDFDVSVKMDGIAGLFTPYQKMIDLSK